MISITTPNDLSEVLSVELMDNMGNDDSVVNAARVSFNKSAEQFTPEQNEKLIKYLANHKHDIPFAHTAITLRVKAPISIRTQCFKHKVGFVENEVSRRYVKERPTYFLPEFRFAPDKSIKQGSAEVIDKTYVREVMFFSDDKYSELIKKDILYGKSTDELNEKWEKYKETLENSHYQFADQELNQQSIQLAYQHSIENLILSYEEMLGYGISPEQARFILPQGIMTEWVWTGSLLAFARFYNLRKSPGAQKEVKDVALLVGNILKDLYPISWKALTDDNV